MSLPTPAHDDPIWDVIQRTGALNDAEPTTPGGPGTGILKRSRRVETPTEWGSSPIPSLGLGLGLRREANKPPSGDGSPREEEEQESKREEDEELATETYTYSYAVEPTCADGDGEGGEVDTYGACIWLGPGAGKVLVSTRTHVLVMTRGSTDMLTLGRTIRKWLHHNHHHHHHHDLLSVLVIGRNVVSTKDLGMALRGRRQTLTRVWAVPSSMANIQRWGLIPGTRPGVPARKALVDGAFDWAQRRLSHNDDDDDDDDYDDCDRSTKLAFTLKAPWDLSPTRHRVNTQSRRDGTGMVLPVLLRTPGMASVPPSSPSLSLSPKASVPLTGTVLDCWLALLPRASALVKVLPCDSVRPEPTTTPTSTTSSTTTSTTTTTSTSTSTSTSASTLILAPIATAGGWMLAAAWPHESEPRMLLYDPLGPPPPRQTGPAPGRAADKARKESLQKFVRLAIPCSRWEDILFATELEPSTTGVGADIGGALVLYVAKQLVERYRDKAPELGPGAWVQYE